MQALSQYKTGTYTGTAAAVTVTCGFTPIYIRVWNETDGDESWEYISGMTAAYAFKTANHDTAQQTVITTNGLTVSTSGFTAGTGLSESAKVFRYIAF